MVVFIPRIRLLTTHVDLFRHANRTVKKQNVLFMIFLRIAHHESLHWNKSWFEHVPCTNAVNTVSRPLLAQVSVWKCILWLLTRVPQPFSEKKKNTTLPRSRWSLIHAGLALLEKISIARTRVHGFRCVMSGLFAKYRAQDDVQDTPTWSDVGRITRICI